ncbi:MAG TPA: CBS domain-containing protein [bacterium]|nr:CBS domain-containing protein [bacterium]
MAQTVAREIMSKDVVSLSPGMSIADAADALLHYRIHGAPVVDKTDQLIGMVSFTDLSARSGGTLRDVMTAEAVAVSEDTPVDEIAALMLDQMVRRVPVVSGGRVTGIVSASDIIQVFLNLHEVSPRQPEAKASASVKVTKHAASPRPSRSAERSFAGGRTRRARLAASGQAGRTHKAHRVR